jgi:hypothetical protein
MVQRADGQTTAGGLLPGQPPTINCIQMGGWQEAQGSGQALQPQPSLGVQGTALPANAAGYNLAASISRGCIISSAAATLEGIQGHHLMPQKAAEQPQQELGVTAGALGRGLTGTAGAKASGSGWEAQWVLVQGHQAAR